VAVDDVNRLFEFPQPYRGKLSVQEITDGINSAFRNAKRLYDDANLLFEAERYPSAVTLAVLAIEEIGKDLILRDLLFVSGQKELSAGWKAFVSHRKKNFFWTLPMLAILGARRLEQFRPVIDLKEVSAEFLDKYKLVATYTDCITDEYHWQEPINAISKSDCELLLGTTRLLVNRHPVTKREIELWAEYVGPEIGKSENLQAAALRKMYVAMRDEGMISEEYSKIAIDILLEGF